MKSEWKKYTLDEVCSRIYSGGTPSTRHPEYWNGELKWLSSGETSQRFIYNTERTITQEGVDNSSTKLAKKGCTVIATAGQGYTRGQASFLMIDTYMNQSVIACEANTKYVMPLYLYYNLDSRYDEFRLLSDGTSTRGGLSGWILKRMEIDLPPLQEQEKIVSILEVLDRKIELNTAINENLQEQAQAVFKSWFVDFDPFGGVMPEDWKVGTFSDIIESTLGGDWGKETLTGNYTEKVYCIRGADIPEVKSGNKGKMPTRYILPKNYKNKKLVADDIVVEISGGSPTQSTGRVTAVSKALLDRYDSGMVCTNFCRAIKPKKGYSDFIYYYWQYLYDSNVFFSYENGTTGIKNLDISGFVGTEPITIPPTKAIEKFNSIIESFFSQIFENGQENERLAALRDTLLPKLMNGEIDVSKIKI